MIDSDVMSRNVATVTPETTITEIVKLLLDRHISAVPVVDESDMKVAIGAAPKVLKRKTPLKLPRLACANRGEIFRYSLGSLNVTQMRGLK